MLNIKYIRIVTQMLLWIDLFIIFLAILQLDQIQLLIDQSNSSTPNKQSRIKFNSQIKRYDLTTVPSLPQISIQISVLHQNKMNSDQLRSAQPFDRQNQSEPDHFSKSSHHEIQYFQEDVESSQAKNQQKSKKSITNAQSIEFQFTQQQFIMIQHFLPKHFTLIEKNPRKTNPSARKQKKDSILRIPVQQTSRLSGPGDLAGQEASRSQFRSKRQRTKIKLTEKYLEEHQLPKNTKKNVKNQNSNENANSQSHRSIEKRNISKQKTGQKQLKTNQITDKKNKIIAKNDQKVQMKIQPQNQQMAKCLKILKHLKRSSKASIFLQPVDPVASGATDYYEVIKNPMDLLTIQKKLQNNQYNSDALFHKDINLIFINAKTYNDKGTKFYKMTEDFEAHYKKIIRQLKNQQQFQDKTLNIKQTQKQSSRQRQRRIRGQKNQKNIDMIQQQMNEENKIQATSAKEDQNDRRRQTFRRILDLSQLNLSDFIRILQDKQLIVIENKEKIEWNLIQNASQQLLNDVQEILNKIQKTGGSSIFKVQQRKRRKSQEKLLQQIQMNIDQAKNDQQLEELLDIEAK